jgi:hypothetical protein
MKLLHLTQSCFLSVRLSVTNVITTCSLVLFQKCHIIHFLPSLVNVTNLRKVISVGLIERIGGNRKKCIRN